VGLHPVAILDPSGGEFYKLFQKLKAPEVTRRAEPIDLVSATFPYQKYSRPDEEFGSSCG